MLEPSAEEVTAAARTLEASYDPATGRLPAELFYATSRTVPRPTIELAIFSADKQKVLLTKREGDDPYFANKWHLPGVMMVPVDTEGTFPNANDNAAMRALEELEGTRVNGLMQLSPEYVDPPARKGPRGVEVPVIYGGLLVPEKPNVGEMFDVDNPPEPLYEHHVALLPACRDAMCIAPARMPVISLGTSQDFIERRRAQASAIQERSGYFDEISTLASTIWEGYDAEDLAEKAKAYQDKAGRGFRKLHSGTGGAFTPNSYQYPFVEVAPGVKMTLREITAGERLRGGGQQNGGEITSIKVVVQAEGLPGNEEHSFADPELDDPGEVTYATIYGTPDSLIEYTDPAMNDNPLLAATADKELLNYVGKVRDGLWALLENPAQ